MQNTKFVNGKIDFWLGQFISHLKFFQSIPSIQKCDKLFLWWIIFLKFYDWRICHFHFILNFLKLFLKSKIYTNHAPNLSPDLQEIIPICTFLISLNNVTHDRFRRVLNLSCVEVKRDPFCPLRFIRDVYTLNSRITTD